MENQKELPLDVQNKLDKERAALYKKWHTNNNKNVIFTDLGGTRYFRAYYNRKMKTISGSVAGGDWSVYYGEIGIENSNG